MVQQLNFELKIIFGITNLILINNIYFKKILNGVNKI